MGQLRENTGITEKDPIAIVSLLHTISKGTSQGGGADAMYACTTEEAWSTWPNQLRSAPPDWPIYKTFASSPAPATVAAAALRQPNSSRSQPQTSSSAALLSAGLDYRAAACSCGGAWVLPSILTTRQAVPYAAVWANPPMSPASNLRQMMALPPRFLHSSTTLPMESFRHEYSMDVNHRSSPPAMLLKAMPRLAPMLRDRTVMP